MTIREKTPEKILVSVEALKTAISEDKTQKELKSRHENSKNVFFAVLGALVSCLLTIIPSWKSWDLWLQFVISLFSIFWGITAFWNGLKMWELGKQLKTLQSEDLVESVINSVKDEVLYTALLVICYQQSKTGEVKFMTEKSGNFLVHCQMEPNKTAAEQSEHIINYLATSYDVQANRVLDVVPFSEQPFFSIKPVHGETRQNGFIFFQIKLKKDAKTPLINCRDVAWLSIREMEEQPDLMGRNQDIVMALNENKTRIIDSFGDTYGPLHIIWNITKDCPYHCAICATCDESRPELSIEDKFKVLDHIFSAKERIDTLDFAGGDPMYKSEIRTVIVQAINSLGEDHISLTTTGMGIQAADSTPDNAISKLLRNCEITIDASHENLKKASQQGPFPRNSPEYCSHNYEQIQNMAENLQHLTINIPLLDDDLDDDEIENLMSKLQKLKNDYSEIKIEAQIIRLMPVGAFHDSYMDSDKYKNYRPLGVAKKISERIGQIGISCRYHCSLRVLPALGICEKRCHMLEKKIGIDCAGNVFACTWGAYLHLPDGYTIERNPFYLGNLTKTSLQNILDGQEDKTSAYKRISRELSKSVSKPYCETVSYYFQGSLDENGDPLSK